MPPDKEGRRAAEVACVGRERAVRRALAALCGSESARLPCKVAAGVRLVEGERPARAILYAVDVGECAARPGRAGAEAVALSRAAARLPRAPVVVWFFPPEGEGGPPGAEAEDRVIGVVESALPAASTRYFGSAVPRAGARRSEHASRLASHLCAAGVL